MSWAELSSVLSLGVVGWVKVEIKAISAQPTEVGVGLSWAELGKSLTLSHLENRIFILKGYCARKIDVYLLINSYLAH